MENIAIERMHDIQVVVQEAKPLLKEPSLYQVIMHNDDYTPMEFVVMVLERFFSMESTQATQVMYQVHTAGRAVCGIFTKDVAETKIDLVVDYARRHEHPLLCSLEGI